MLNSTLKVVLVVGAVLAAAFGLEAYMLAKDKELQRQEEEQEKQRAEQQKDDAAQALAACASKRLSAEGARSFIIHERHPIGFFWAADKSRAPVKILGPAIHRSKSLPTPDAPVLEAIWAWSKGEGPFPEGGEAVLAQYGASNDPFSEWPPLRTLVEDCLRDGIEGQALKDSVAKIYLEDSLYGSEDRRRRLWWALEKTPEFAAAVEAAEAENLALVRDFVATTSKSNEAQAKKRRQTDGWIYAR